MTISQKAFSEVAKIPNPAISISLFFNDWDGMTRNGVKSIQWMCSKSQQAWHLHVKIQYGNA